MKILISEIILNILEVNKYYETFLHSVTADMVESPSVVYLTVTSINLTNTSLHVLESSCALTLLSGRSTLMREAWEKTQTTVSILRRVPPNILPSPHCPLNCQSSQCHSDIRLWVNLTTARHSDSSQLAVSNVVVVQSSENKATSYDSLYMYSKI